MVPQAWHELGYQVLKEWLTFSFGNIFGAFQTVPGKARDGPIDHSKSLEGCF